MAEGTSGSGGQQPQKAKRNPVERALVWGFIGVMLVIVANEGYARFAYNHALQELGKKVALIEEKEDAPPVTQADVKEAMWGKKPTREEDLSEKPMANGASRVEEYNWFTVHPTNKLRMFVYYGHQGKDGKGAEVLSVVSEEEKVVEFKPPTKEQIEEAQKQAAANGATGGMPPGMMPQGMPGMRGMGPPGRGGPPGASGRPTGSEGPKDQPAETGDKPEAAKTDGDAPAEKADDTKSDEAKSDEAKSDEAKPDPNQ